MWRISSSQTEIHIDGSGSYYEVSTESTSGKKLEQAQINLNDCLACSYVLDLLAFPPFLILHQRLHHLRRICPNHTSISQRGFQLSRIQLQAFPFRALQDPDNLNLTSIPCLPRHGSSPFQPEISILSITYNTASSPPPCSYFLHTSPWIRTCF
jgi:hypothetical protein